METVYFVKKLNDVDNPEVLNLIDKLSTLLNEYDVPVLENLEDTDLHTVFISIGGDGTMMQAMKYSYEKQSMCIGANLGNLGFLTHYTKDNISDVLTDMFCHDCDGSHYDVKRRFLIEGNERAAVNEFVISSSNSRDTIQYNVYVDNDCIGHHTSSAFIVSSATGSTAYALNSGGAIVSPDEQIMQLLHVNPACISNRPIILGKDKNVRVEVTGIRGTGKLELRCDGINVIEEGQTSFKFNVGFHSAWIAVPNMFNYFDTLTKKLHWNKHFI